MEGNVVRAAYILGGSLVLSTLFAGAGLLVASRHFATRIGAEADRISRRSAEAVLEAPKNTTVAFPRSAAVHLRLQNAVNTDQSLDILQVELKPTLKDKEK